MYPTPSKRGLLIVNDNKTIIVASLKLLENSDYLIPYKDVISPSIKTEQKVNRPGKISLKIRR